MADAETGLDQGQPLCPAVAWNVFMRLPKDLALQVVRHLGPRTKRQLRGCCKALYQVVNATVDSLIISFPAAFAASKPIGETFPHLTTVMFWREWPQQWPQQSPVRFCKVVRHHLSGGQLGQRLRRLALEVEPDTHAAYRQLVVDCGSLPALQELRIMGSMSLECKAQRELMTAPRSGLLTFHLYRDDSALPLLFPTSQLQHLRHLTLGNYEKSDEDTVVGIVLQLPQLVRLTLDGTELQGGTLGSLSMLVHLRKLSVGVAGSTERAMRELGTLQQLTALNVRISSSGRERNAESNRWEVRDPEHVHHLSVLHSLVSLKVYVRLRGPARRLLLLPQLRQLHVEALWDSPEPRPMLVSSRLRNMDVWLMEGALHMSRVHNVEGSAAFLTQLRADYASATPNDMHALALHTGLRSLSIGLNDAVSDGCLCAALGQLTRLTQLSLRHLHSITDAGVQALSSLTRLAKLELDRSDMITDAGMMVTLGLPQLRSLGVYKIVAVSPAFLAALLTSGAPSLCKLSFSMNPQLTVHACREMVKRHIGERGMLRKVHVTYEKRGYRQDENPLLDVQLVIESEGTVSTKVF